MTNKQITSILTNEPSKRRAVIQIIELFNGVAFNDALQTIDIVSHFLKAQAYIDANLARNFIEGAVADASD